MSFGSGQSRGRKPYEIPPMQRTNEITGIIEKINNPSSIFTQDTANNRLIEYYNQLKKQNNEEYDKIQYSTTPSKTNDEMKALGFIKYIDILQAGGGGGGLGGGPLPNLFGPLPAYVPSDQELQEMRTRIFRMQQYQRQQQQPTETTPTETKTPTTETTIDPQRSAEWFFAKTRIAEILKNPDATPEELNTAIELFNNIQDLEDIKIRIPTRQITAEDYSDYKAPSTSSSSTSNISMTMTPTPLIRKTPTFLQTTINPLEYKQILQLSTKGNKNKKGINITVLKRILQRLIADQRGLIPLLIDDLQSVINQPAFSTFNQPKQEKKPLVKKKTSNSKIKTAIIDRVLAFNEELQQTILNIITFYYPNTVSDFTTDNVIDEIMNTSDMINLSKFYKALLKAIKDSIKKLNYPEWFYNLFQPIPMDVTVPDVEMAPSIRDATEQLLPMLINPMINMGIPPVNAQEWALKIIESQALQELKYIYETGDWQGTVDELTLKTVREVGAVVNEIAKVRKLDPMMALTIIYKITKEITKQGQKSYITKIKGVRNLAGQIINEAPRQQLIELKTPSITIEEFKEAFQEDFKNDVVNIGGTFRVGVRNLDRMNIPPIIRRGINKIKRLTEKKQPVDYFDYKYNADDKYYGYGGDPDDDPDDEPDYGDYGDDFDDEDIPDMRDIYPNAPDPDPDDPNGEPELDIFFRGRNRNIKIKTLVLALLALGVTATTIYKVIKRILAMEQYKLIEDNKTEDNKNSNNIENKMPDLATYKLAYLQVAQAYLQAQEDGKDEATLQKYRNQLIELKNIIDKLTATEIYATGPNPGDPGYNGTTDTPGTEQTPVTGETPDSIVDFNPELETIEGSGDSMLRAEVEDPNEVKLFLNTNRVAKEQQKMFNNFSRRVFS